MQQLTKNNKKNNRGDIATWLLIIFFIVILFVSAKFFGLEETMLEKSFKNALNGSITNVNIFIHHILDTYFK